MQKYRWFSGIESFVAEFSKIWDNYATENVPILGAPEGIQKNLCQMKI